MNEADYSGQRRGSAEAYQRYLRGMDASMRQKVALTAAHFLCRGQVADMGMGSGAGSYALAALYPDLQVTGVDVDEAMVELAGRRYQLPNLKFVQGDISSQVFEPESLDGIFDSSVLHHVTTFGGYRYDNAAVTLEAQAAQLKPHGVLVVRDFVAPVDGDRTVFLDLPAEDGDDSSEPLKASTAALFCRFAREFRSLSSTPGFSYEEGDAPRSGWRRFLVPRRIAVEFVLRKDYRPDWEAEVKEEYTYFTQPEFEALFARLGLRLLASTPIWNPWIVANRWLGKVELRDSGGELLELPPTNYLIAAERVPSGEGVRFVESEGARNPFFLQMSCYLNRATRQVLDVVRRPRTTVDILPYFVAGSDVFVLAKMSYPRPLLSIGSAKRTIDGSTPAPYVTEPLNLIQGDLLIGETVEFAVAEYGVPAERIRRLQPIATYYPSPGGVVEEVRSALVEIEPTFVEEPAQNRTGLTTSGRVRAIEACQLLRAAQVGGLTDARLEINVYELLLQLSRDVGPWIGEEIEINDGGVLIEASPLAHWKARPLRRAFERANSAQSTGFLSLSVRTFEEVDQQGRVLASKNLEVVEPRNFSCNTVATALLRRDARGFYIGVDDDDLPAAQCSTGCSALLVAPAWRLPRDVVSMTRARAFVKDRLASEYRAETKRIWQLGGHYYPAPGATPEVVYPLAVEIGDVRPGGRPIYWVPLADARDSRSQLVDGHLRVVALRAAHALGLLSRT